MGVEAAWHPWVCKVVCAVQGSIHPPQTQRVLVWVQQQQQQQHVDVAAGGIWSFEHGCGSSMTCLGLSGRVRSCFLLRSCFLHAHAVLWFAVVQDSHGNFYDCCLTLQPAVVRAHKRLQPHRGAAMPACIHVQHLLHTFAVHVAAFELLKVQGSCHPGRSSRM